MSNENKNILIVDDEEAIVTLLETILNIYGYNATTCTNPVEATTMAETMQPSLIILDVAMPDKDGYEVCLDLKKNPLTRDIPVLMVTALALIQDKKKGLACGADGFVFKPFDPNVVVTEIEKLISRQ